MSQFVCSSALKSRFTGYVRQSAGSGFESLIKRERGELLLPLFQTGEIYRISYSGCIKKNFFLIISKFCFSFFSSRIFLSEENFPGN